MALSPARICTTAFWIFEKIDVAPGNISRTFHTPLLSSFSLFVSVKSRVGNASAVFFPSLKDCVIEAKWLGKPFGFVRHDFAKKCQKVVRLSRKDNVPDIYLKRDDILRDSEFLLKCKKNVLPFFPSLFLSANSTVILKIISYYFHLFSKFPNIVYFINIYVILIYIKTGYYLH